MSKGRKSEYPERPVSRNRPRSSTSGGKKGRSWVEQNVSIVRVEEKTATLDVSRCSFGHRNALPFLHTYRMNRVPIHIYGKKGRTETA